MHISARPTALNNGPEVGAASIAPLLFLAAATITTPSYRQQGSEEWLKSSSKATETVSD